MNKLYMLIAFVVVVLGIYIFSTQEKVSSIGSFAPNARGDREEKPTTIPTPTIPAAKMLPNDYHIFQTFNNCGPAALSMALSYYDIFVSQEELGRDVRPNQHPKGINDDKSVTLDELAIKAEEYGFTAYHRPNGSVDLIKQFIAQDIPVVARTWLTSGEDIGHYRVIKGYDDTTKQFIQDDSLQGKNLIYSYTDFLSLWEVFNYEYLVLVPRGKERYAQDILGENFDQNLSWTKAVEISQEKLIQEPNNIHAAFNLSVAYYNSGRAADAIASFEQIQHKLSRRTLWYQIEPIQAYLAVGNYQKVYELVQSTLASENKAYAEAYLLQAEAFRLEGRTESSKIAFSRALRYNTNLIKYQTLLPEASIQELMSL